MTPEQIKLKRAAGRALWLKRWARRPPAVGVEMRPARIFSLHDPGWSYQARRWLEEWPGNNRPGNFVRLNRAIWPKKLK